MISMILHTLIKPLRLKQIAHGITQTTNSTSQTFPLFVFCINLEPKNPATSPIKINENVLKAVEDDAQEETPATPLVTDEKSSNESKETKQKLIQKETVETGSVSSIEFYIDFEI